MSKQKRPRRPKSNVRDRINARQGPGFWPLILFLCTALVATVLFCIAKDVRHVDTYECPVCRLKKKQVRYIGLAASQLIQTNAFSEWYHKVDSQHAHLWLPRASMGYNCFGSVRYSAYLEQRRFFMIDPMDEKGFLVAHFSIDEVRTIARNLGDGLPADALYFAMYLEGTNQEASLET